MNSTQARTQSKASQIRIVENAIRVAVNNGHYHASIRVTGLMPNFQTEYITAHFNNLGYSAGMNGPDFLVSWQD